MIPFDMARFDGLKEVITGTMERRRPVVERILETAKVLIENNLGCFLYILFNFDLY